MYIFQLLRPVDENYKLTPERSFANVILILFPKRFKQSLMVEEKNSRRFGNDLQAGSGISPVFLSSLSQVNVRVEGQVHPRGRCEWLSSGRNSHEAFVKYSTGRPCCVYSTGDTVLPCNSCIQRVHSIKDLNIIFPRIPRNCCFSITFEPPVWESIKGIEVTISHLSRYCVRANDSNCTWSLISRYTYNDSSLVEFRLTGLNFP